MRYRLYIDESGDHTYKNLEFVGRRYLALLGVGIETQYYRTEFQPKLESLKQLHFPHNPDEPIILHREDIYNRRRCFGVLFDDETNIKWERGFNEFIKEASLTLFLVVIDKKHHKETYGEAAIHPYHLAMTFLLERYKGFLNRTNSKGDVMAESRGKKEDQELANVYHYIWNNGTYYNNAKGFQNVLTSKNLKIKRKTANIAGLQIADLLAHPTKMHLLESRDKINWRMCFGKSLVPAFECKFDEMGQKLFG